MKKILLILMFFWSFSASTSPLPSLNEAEILGRLYSELDALKPLIDESMRKTDRQGRFGFDYQRLQSDIYLVKSGLRAAVYGTRLRNPSKRYLFADYGDVGVVGETASLQVLLHEIQALFPLVHEAEHNAIKNSRVQVDYTVLNGDLYSIIEGIQQSLAGAGDFPREIAPLRGSFSHG